MNEYGLALLAVLWLADGMALLLAPRFVVEQLREALAIRMPLWPWQCFAVVAGILLLWKGSDLPYHALWICAGAGMIGQAAILTVAPATWRDRIVTWLLQREEIDYRFAGLALCLLAVLLLHAIGWVGAPRT